MRCQYCGGEAGLVKGLAVYPGRRDLWDLDFWKCGCGAYVGCHKGTTKPLGTLADSELRIARQRVHLVFDVIWESGRMDRNTAYRLLADRLGIAKTGCHTAMFDLAMCARALAAAEAIRKEMGL